MLQQKELEQMRAKMLLHEEFFEELTSTGLLRVRKQLFGWPLLPYTPLIHENGPVRNVTGTAHFVGNDNHRAFFLRKLTDRV